MWPFRPSESAVWARARLLVGYRRIERDDLRQALAHIPLPALSGNLERVRRAVGPRWFDRYILGVHR